MKQKYKKIKDLIRFKYHQYKLNLATQQLRILPKHIQE